MIKVSNDVPIYEVQGKKATSEKGEKTLLVLSHWNEPNKLVLSFGGETITVVAKDLQTAIQNATNTSRY